MEHQEPGNRDLLVLGRRIAKIQEDLARVVDQEKKLDDAHARELGMLELGSGSEARVNNSRQQWKASRQRRVALASALAELQGQYASLEAEIRREKARRLEAHLADQTARAQAIVARIVAMTREGQGLVTELRGLSDEIMSTGAAYSRLTDQCPGRLPDLTGPLSDRSLADPTGADARFSPAAAALRLLGDLGMSWNLSMARKGGPRKWDRIGEAPVAAAPTE
jgi:hypothetical protein